MSNRSLMELGANKDTVKAILTASGKCYSAVCRAFWEIRRTGKAKRTEVFKALRSDGIRFGGSIAVALWKLADEMQVSSTWSKEMTERAEKTARDSAHADSKKHGKKTPYDKALSALEVLTDFLKEDSTATSSLDFIALCVDAMKPEPAATGDAEAATGDAEAATGDAKAATGDAKAATGDAEAATGDAKAATGDAEAAPTPATLAAFNADDRELLKDFLSDVKGALKPVKTGDAEAAPTSAVA